MSNPNVPKMHKIKAMDRNVVIALCGKSIHYHTHTRDDTKVTCKNCLRQINKRINEDG